MVDIIKKRVWSDGRQLFAPVSTELQKTKNIYHNPNHQQTLTFYQNSRIERNVVQERSTQVALTEKEIHWL